MTRRLLAALLLPALALAVTARADLSKTAPGGKDDRAVPEVKGDPRVLIEDTATRQAQLKRAFESFRQRLAILAGRLENGTDKDKEKARALRGALKRASELGTEAKFDALIRDLTRPGADQNIDVLGKVVRENADLRKDLQQLISLLAKDDTQSNKEKMDKTAKLLEQLKDLIAKQERVRAQTEMGRKDNKELGKDQNKVTRETREVADGKKGDKEAKGQDTARGEFKGEGKPGVEGKGEARQDTNSKAEGKPAEGKEGAGKEGKDGDGKEGKGGEGKPGEGKEGKDGKGGEGKSGEGKEGKGGEGKDSKSGEGKEGKPGEGKPGEGKPGSGKEGKEGKGGEGKPGAGKEGKSGEGKSGESKSGEGKPGGKSGEGKSGEGKPGSKSGEGKSGEGKPSAGKPGEGKSGESKGQGQGKGEAKPGKPGEGKPGQSGKPGESKGGKSGEGKPGSGKPGSSGGGSQGGEQQPPAEENPVKKQIEDANKYQKQAETDLDKNKKDDASESQSKAIKELEAAKKKLEELLKQMREEEIERLLADLEKRCRYMLALQIEVRDGTVALDKEITGSPDGRPTLIQGARSNKLADKEDEIVREAHAALKLIQTEGSAVAFAEVFEQVSKDMEVIRGRLNRTDVTRVTQAIENDVIETLKEMIDALKKAQRDMKQQQGKPGKPGQSGPQDQKLIDQLAELKMIHAMQKRVNARTELYGNQYKGEQAPLPSFGKDAKEREHYETVQKELKDLADRQEKIGRVTRDIATGKNEAK